MRRSRLAATARSWAVGKANGNSNIRERSGPPRLATTQAPSSSSRIIAVVPAPRHDRFFVLNSRADRDHGCAARAVDRHRGAPCAAVVQEREPVWRWPAKPAGLMALANCAARLHRRDANCPGHRVRAAGLGALLQAEPAGQRLVHFAANRDVVRRDPHRDGLRADGHAARYRVDHC